MNEAQALLAQSRAYFRLVVLIGLLIAIFVPHLASLGTVLTIDEPLWQGRAGQFIRAVSVGQLDKTLVAGQPGITTAWLAGMADRFHSLAASQAAIALTTGVLILICTYFLTYLWGWRWGMVAGYFIALDPFLLGHSRVVHTDALLALFYLASLLALLGALLGDGDEPRPIHRYGIASGVLGGLAILTKLFGLLLLPTGLLLAAYMALRRRLPVRDVGKFTVTWFGVIFLTIYIFWPALWSNPDTVLTYLTGRTEIHAEGTRSQETTTAWWYYGRESAFRLTAPVTLLGLIGLAGLAKRGSSRMRLTTALMLIAGLGYALALSTSADKSDRYVLLTLLTIQLLAVFGLRTLVDWATLRWKIDRSYVALAIVVPIIWIAIQTVRLHPYHLAHYNRLYPIEVEHKLGWGEGLEQAAAWVEDQAPGASVASYYSRVFDHFYDGPVSAENHREGSDYLVLYRSMFERGPDHPDTDLVNQYILSPSEEPAHTIHVNGLPYVWIYQLSRR